ncbi:MAG: hypothetical protein KVP17_000707 [Porospora cf. gigantea B]|uniref:uncharacterized protein n=1 Tax=Porospora cf. gigantea B TaxID=2853592 RepID=UPI003571D25A|nr:MAG: hypothetical protein KVP17_000707 [Porospora cf. gigantea B]
MDMEPDAAKLTCEPEHFEAACGLPTALVRREVKLHRAASVDHVSRLLRFTENAESDEPPTTSHVTGWGLSSRRLTELTCNLQAKTRRPHQRVANTESVAPPPKRFWGPSKRAKQTFTPARQPTNAPPAPEGWCRHARSSSRGYKPHLGIIQMPRTTGADDRRVRKAVEVLNDIVEKSQV